MASSGGVAIATRPPRGSGTSRSGYQGFTPPTPRVQNRNRTPTPGQARPQRTAGHWVPQGDNWQLIHAVGKNRWAPGGVRGRRAPNRPTGPTPLPNNPLAPLTQNQIQREATSTITKAYGPANVELNSQASQARNLYQAQTADDRYFAKWLAGQTQDLNTKVGNVNAQLAGVLQGFQQQQQAGLAAQTAGAASAEQAQPGMTAQPGQVQAALSQEIAPATGAANAHTAAAAAQGVQNSIYQQQQAQNTGEVGQARVSARQTQELGNLNTTLTNIANTRAKLVAGKISDIAKEITRLQGVELSKRQWLRSEGDLEAKIGVAKDVAKTNAAYKSAQATTARDNAVTARLRARETAAHNRAMAKITASHYASQGAREAAAAAERARHNRVMEGIGQKNANTSATRAANAANGTGPGGKSKFGTPTQQRAVTNYMEKVRGALTTDIQRFHNGDPRALQLAYHDLASGRYSKFYGGLGNPPAGGNPSSYLNAAVNTLSQYGGGGLTPGDIAFLNSQGLQVGSRYPRTTDKPPKPPRTSQH